MKTHSRDYRSEAVIITGLLYYSSVLQDCRIAQFCSIGLVYPDSVCDYGVSRRIVLGECDMETIFT